MTRDMMAVFISRALAGGDSLVPTGPATATFTDVPTTHWAYKYVEYAVDQGVVGGYSDGTYRPTLTVTRDMMAVFVARAMCGGDASVPTGPATAVLHRRADHALGLPVRGVHPRRRRDRRLRGRDLPAAAGGGPRLNGGVRAAGVCVADVGPCCRAGWSQPARRP